MGMILDDRKLFCNNSLAECKPAMFYDFLMDIMEKFIEVCLTLDVCVEWLATGKGPKRPPCDHIKPAPILSDEQKLQLKKITELVCG